MKAGWRSDVKKEGECMWWLDFEEEGGNWGYMGVVYNDMD